jgi:CBS domain-containing protein
MEQKLLENLIIDEFTSFCTFTGNPDQTCLDLMRTMKEHRVRHLPIIENNEVIGIVTERDLNLIINSDHGRKLIARDAMVTDPFIVKSGAALRDVVFDMSEKKVGSAIVKNFENKSFGIFTSVDAMNALIEVLQ